MWSVCFTRSLKCRYLNLCSYSITRDQGGLSVVIAYTRRVYRRYEERGHRKLTELHHPIKGSNRLRLDGGRNVGIGRRLRYMFVEGDVFVLRKAHEKEKRGEEKYEAACPDIVHGTKSRSDFQTKNMYIYIIHISCLYIVKKLNICWSI